MFAGFRLSEWAQPTTETDKKLGFRVNVDNTATAFIAHDVVFKNTRQQVITWHPTINVDVLRSATLTWRFQKNKLNRTARTFGARSDSAYCPVQALHRILCRAHRLCIPSHSPIAVFRTAKGPQFISDRHIESSLRSCATQVYRLTQKADIQRFSSHSIRVGACVFMHECGKDAVFIQFRLR